MGLFKKVTSKITEAASTVVSDTVKVEVKKAASDISPLVIGLGSVVAGIVAFRMASKPHATKAIPAATITVVTNNYFFDEAAKADVLSKIIGH